MAKIIEFVSKNWKTILLGILVLFLIWTSSRACQLRRAELKLAGLSGEVKTLRSEAVAREERYALEKREVEKTIAAKDAEIATHQGNIDSLNTIITQREETIDGLSEDLAGATTDAERVPILVGLVAEYKAEVFTLKQTIGEKDKMYFSLREKYDLEHKLRLDAEAGWDGEKKMTLKLSDEVRAGGRVISKLQGQLSAWKIPAKVAVVVAGVLIIRGAV